MEEAQNDMLEYAMFSGLGDREQNEDAVAAAQRGDAFLLCSDGFWEPVVEKDMQKTLKKTATAQAWLDALQALAEKNGTPGDMDNYSAIAVRLCDASRK